MIAFILQHQRRQGIPNNLAAVFKSIRYYREMQGI